jgi:hypothetical protein
MRFVGLDLGQRRDHTAIATVEKAGEQMVVRHAERVMLGTPWALVVERVRAIVSHPRMIGQSCLVVDATGVGSPVVEMLRNARLGCEVVAVTITGGDRESQTAQGWSVPKRDLMTGLQLGLENGAVKIARGMREVGALVRELVDVRASGVRMSAEGAGQHDDLVIAVALAVWKARQKKKSIVFESRRGAW